MTRPFIVGDYVKYKGDQTIQSGMLRHPDVGRIDKFEMLNGKKSIYLYLLENKQHIWCEHNKIQEIWTNEQILKRIGFKESKNPGVKNWLGTLQYRAALETGSKELENLGVKVYSLNGIKISSGSFINDKEWITTGFCVADFTQITIDVEKYINEGEFDRRMFHSDYPSVHNVNDLIPLINMEKVGIEKLLKSQLIFW